MPITRFEDLDLSRQYTYADYVAWQFRERVELLRGWVARMSPAPSRYHPRVAGNLYLDIGRFLRERRCEAYSAPFDVRLPRTSGGETVVQPGICVIRDESNLTDQGCTGAPDWVIEVSSPQRVPSASGASPLRRSDSKREMRDKYALYEESGVRAYWIVDPEHNAVLTYTLEGERPVNGPTYHADDEAPFAPRLFPELSLRGQDIF